MSSSQKFIKTTVEGERVWFRVLEDIGDNEWGQYRVVCDNAEFVERYPRYGNDYIIKKGEVIEEDNK